jgi:hypothetical protein
MTLFYADRRLPPDIRLRMQLTLYQRDDCHLCELALTELARAATPEFRSVFIDGNADLEARYGIRIPVLREQVSGRELGWPFDEPALRRFLTEVGVLAP